MASYLDEAVQALQTSNVYMSPLANSVDPATRTELEMQADGSNVAVIILPADAVNEIGGNSTAFIAEIVRRTGYDTVVVAFGSDLQAASNELPGGLAGQLADQAEAEYGTTGSSLREFISEVGVARNQDDGAESPSIIGPVAGVLLGIVILLGLAATLVVRKQNKLRQRAATTNPSPEPRQPTVHDQLQASLGEMRKLAMQISDSQLHLDTLWSMTETEKLLGYVGQQRPDLLEEKTKTYLEHITRINRILAMYIKAQNPILFGNAQETEEVMAATRRVITKYMQDLQNNLDIIDPTDMINFYVDVESVAPKPKGGTT